MAFADEIKGRFGGLWNGVLLIVIVVICFRFATAEWGTESLWLRLLYGLYLVLGLLAFGVILAVTKLFKSNPAEVAWGLKYGIFLGGTFLFLLGCLMVPDFLGPLDDIVTSFFARFF